MQKKKNIQSSPKAKNASTKWAPKICMNVHVLILKSGTKQLLNKEINS